MSLFRARGLPRVVSGASRISGFQGLIFAWPLLAVSSCRRACSSYVSRFLYVPVVMVWLSEGLLWPRDLSWPRGLDGLKPSLWC